jgi:hypothetical protein
MEGETVLSRRLAEVSMCCLQAVRMHLLHMLMNLLLLLE